MPKVLIADDSPSSVRIVQNALANSDVEVLSAGCAAEAWEAIAHCHPDVVILDIMLPDCSGLESFDRIHKLDPTVPVIFITAAGTSDTAIEAMRLGALDYLLKPLDLLKVRELVSQAIKIRHFIHVPVHLNEVDAEKAAKGDLLIGRCPAMQEVYKAIGRVAQQNIAVLIRGESGTGKELVARAICQHGPRSTKPFLAVNCAAIPETLLESELFGHEKGSFTGASARRIGKFEQCNRGTLFLDEVGDMTALMQSKILRVLQDKRFERVGGNETIKSDVWIVAATNRDLEAMVAGGQFRSDLYYRLNGYSITLPPLRDRSDDIPLLARHFLTRFARELGKPVCEISPETMELLVCYSWPGNVRELQSTLKQAMIQATGQVLLPEFLSRKLRGLDRPESIGLDAGASQANPLEVFIGQEVQRGTKTLYADTIAHVERILLTHVLRDTSGNRSQAAQILGISRGLLRKKIRTHGVFISHSVDIENDGEEAEDEAPIAPQHRPVLSVGSPMPRSAAPGVDKASHSP